MKLQMTRFSLIIIKNEIFQIIGESKQEFKAFIPGNKITLQQAQLIIIGLIF